MQVASQIQETLDELERGIYLAEGVAKVVGVAIKTHHKNSTILEMILDEGRNREIRRLLARVGHKVQRLVRIGMGPLKLGDMPAGAYRLLRHDEIAALQDCVQGAIEGARPHKPKRRPERGSRKLLQQRKAEGSTGQAGRATGSSATEAAGKKRRPTGSFGGVKLSGAARNKSSSATGGAPRATKRPYPRTIIGDLEPTENAGESSSHSAQTRTPRAGKKPPGAKAAFRSKAKDKSKFAASRASTSERPTGAARPGGKAKRKGKPAFRQGKSTGK